MFDQELEIKVEIMGHDGWGSIFYNDVRFPLNRANIIPFRTALKKALEDILNNSSCRYVSMNRLHEKGTVLRFTYYHKGVNGYRDSIVQHIKMTEEGWRCGIISFAEKIWRN